MDIEKKVKEIVYTSLGVYVALAESLEENAQKLDGFVSDKTSHFKKTLDELEARGQTDNSEVVVAVRNSVKDFFKSIDELQSSLQELTETNYARLKLELGKYNIELPDLNDLKANINKALDEGKVKAESLAAKIKPAPKAEQSAA